MWINGQWYTESEVKSLLDSKDKRIAELEDKHWGECRQIAHYDDELREADEGGYIRKADVLDLITDVQNDGGFKGYSDYSRLWEEVDNMPTTFIELTEGGDTP